MKNSSIRRMTEAAVIAALYAVLTIAVSPIGYGQVQFRVSEALTILPVFTSSSIPGLFIGCIISNAVGIFTGANVAGAWDILLGSAATLTAALCSYFTRKITVKGIPLLAFFFPVLLNGLVVGTELAYVLSLPYIATMLFVALGEAAVCYTLGTFLFLAIRNIGVQRVFPYSR